MPNRIIKETIRTSKSVSSMTDFQFRFWIYLITYVDDYGRGSADPEILKAFLFPRRNTVRVSDIEKSLAELDDQGSIHLYNVDGEPYLCLPKWGVHQRIQAKTSKFPEPEAASYGNSPLLTVSHRESPPNTRIENRESRIEIDDFFESLWKVYPKKKGKGQITDAQKRRLFSIGFEELKRCIERYSTYCAGKDEQFVMYGSTFFNSGYVDYLDDNYAEPSSQSSAMPETKDMKGKVYQ